MRSYEVAVKEQGKSIDPILIDGLMLGVILMPLVFGLRTTLAVAGIVMASSKAAEAALPFLPQDAQDRYRRTIALSRQVTGG